MNEGGEAGEQAAGEVSEQAAEGAGERARRGGAWALLGLWMLLFYPAISAIVATSFGRSGTLVTVVVLAIVAALPGPSRWLQQALLRPTTMMFVGSVAVGCAAFSSWFVAFMLGGKELALDCSVYLMQARALANGELGAPSQGNVLNESARFLFEGADGRLYGVFPPGYPLFLALFERFGVPMASGPILAALLVVAQYWLARVIGEDEWVARASLLLTVPSYVRAVQTADLLSHAFVALLATVALGTTLRLREGAWLRRGALVGVCVGWVFCARMLDGLVLGLVVAVAGGWVAWQTRSRRLVAVAAVAALTALPFVGLVLAQQKASTGQWLRPSQFEFFARSDFPASCHRLGLGKDVGCSVEHPPERASFGPDGYTIDDALRVGAERAVVFGNDVVGFAPLVLLGMASLVVAPTAEALVLGLWWVGLSLAYLLFYYGNAPVYGARHLFPLTPAVLILVVRMLTRLPRLSWLSRRPAGRLDAGHAVGGALLALLTILSLAQIERWRRARWQVKGHQAARADVHRLAGSVRDSIVLVDDTFSFIGAIDPWRDRGVRRVAPNDRAGVIELRRQHPGWPVLLATPKGLIPIPDLPPVTPGLHLELELAWPSRIWPSGLASRRVDSLGALKVPSSGNEALGIHQGGEGGELTIVFDTVEASRQRLQLDGIAGPLMGRYEVSVDGQMLPSWDGYAPRYERRTGEQSAPIELAAGRHRLRFRCVGRAPESKGALAIFDTLRGEP